MSGTALAAGIFRGYDEIMRDSARYVKIVEWSEEDGAFVGQCPGVIGPCCHGPNEADVYRELCTIVEEWLELARRRKENRQ